MTEHMKKMHVNNKNDSRRFQKKLRLVQQENTTLKQRLESLELSNEKLETENVTYLKVIKNKIKAENTEHKVNNVISIDDNNVDLQYKNDVLKLVVQKCEDCNDMLKEQLCHVFLSQHNKINNENENFENIKDIFDKYLYHIDFNTILRNENKHLIEINKFLKNHVLVNNNLEADMKCKRRKVVTFNGNQLRKCEMDPTSIYEEYSYKRKCETVLKEHEIMHYSHNIFLQTVNKFVKDVNVLLEYIYKNVLLVNDKISKQINNVYSFENQVILHQQNYENLLALHKLKMEEFEKMENILKGRNDIINEMQKEIEMLNNDELKNRDTIDILMKENMDLEEKLQVLTQIIDNCGQDENRNRE